jgi:hypothetical protein
MDLRPSRRPIALSLLVSVFLLPSPAFSGGDAGGDDVVARALPNAKHSLLEGLRIAGTTPAVAISAKFEDEGKGLSLSVYTAARGLDVDAESNLLQELAGDATTPEWKPSVATFDDPVHVARASEQLTLMRSTKLSLADVVQRADSLYGSLHGAKVFSIAPAIRDGKGVFLVRVVAEGKVFALPFDLQTGAAVAPWPRMPRRPEATPLVGTTLSDPVLGTGRWVGSPPRPLEDAARERVVLVASNSYG